MDFADRLKALRKRARLSQEALAAKAGRSGQSWIGNFETRRQAPRLEDVIPLAAALDAHPGELFADLPSQSAGLLPGKVMSTTKALLTFMRRRDPKATLDLSTQDDAELFAGVYAVALALPASPTEDQQIEFAAKVEDLISARERRDERTRSQSTGSDSGKEAGDAVPGAKARSKRR